MFATAKAIVYNASAWNRMSNLELLKQVPLFQGLTDSELKALTADFVRQELRPDEALFYQGDAGHFLYVVETGKVRIFVQGDDGQELSVTVCGTGDLVGEMSVIDELPRSASAVALERATVLRLSRERFREHVRKSPQLAFNVMKALSVRLRFSTRQLDSLSMASVPTRLARKLLELADQHGVAEGREIRIAMTLTQSELASLLGATRESVNKALGQLKRQGLIRQDEGQLIIVNRTALEGLSQTRS
jgi:CRP-like cAMP-binding protein